MSVFKLNKPAEPEQTTPTTREIITVVRQEFLRNITSKVEVLMGSYWNRLEPQLDALIEAKVHKRVDELLAQAKGQIADQIILRLFKREATKQGGSDAR